MRRKRLVKTLSWAVENGALTKREARAVLALGASAGVFGRPDANTRQSTVRVKGQQMAKLKATSPDALKGTKAGELMTAARVKDVGDRLDRKRHEVRRPNGSALVYGSKALELPSQYDLALIGAWFKASLIAAGHNHNLGDGQKRISLSEFEKSLLVESAAKDQWIGQSKGYDYGGHSADGYIPATEVKSLLDDSVSGGIYAVPAVLDTALITTPLLSGQIAPFVDMKPIGGRRVIAPKMTPLTGGWGTAPGTPVQPFNTSGLMSSVDTPTFTFNGFLELSNELEADSAIDLGAAVVDQFGERLRSELDRVVAVGNGTSEPLGVFNTSGLLAVSSDSGPGGPPTVSDAESLIFAQKLEYRQQNWNACFIGNDTTYRRLRSIQVGAGDERRVFGQGMMGTDDTQRYQLFEYKYRVQNDIPNNKCGFVALKRYRLYVRAGMEVIRERFGRTLALSNTQLLGLRARYGGQLIDTAAASVMTDLQS